ncbi:hypothetical protein [Salinigranum salinum]|uniref:hypothetical protein n=1 Tax=Salinigranum salinum TaxID=1364937 RepID=UPI0012604961|nr:hypothetical protein [Salinigranum salinum]
MRRGTILGLRVTAVVLSFALVLEGPDFLLLAVRDVRLWLPIGVVSGILTLPLLWWQGVGLVPPWTMPVYDTDTARWRVGVYHLVCSVLVAWLWTYPTLRVVAWVHRWRGLDAAAGTVPADAVSVAAGLVLSALVFLLPALVIFIRLSTFRTTVDLRTARVADLLRPGVVGIGSYLLVGVVVSLASFLATTA